MDAVKGALKNELIRTLKPHLEFKFEHVREGDFRIWGRKDNIALSKRTICEIFSAIRTSENEILECPFSKYNNSCEEKSLFRAGYKSARLFIDDLCDLLIEGDTLDVPGTIECLFLLALSFDEKSAWWESPFAFYNENDWYSLELNKPFTKFPFVSDGNSSERTTQSPFLEGYFLGIFNGGSDLLYNLFNVAIALLPQIRHNLEKF